MSSDQPPAAIGDIVVSVRTKWTDGEVLAAYGDFAWVHWPANEQPMTMRLRDLAVTRRAAAVQELL